MTGPVFVDTNVLIYARDASEPEKRIAAAGWMGHLWRTQAGRLSYQVLLEFYVTVTEKLKPGMDRSAARNEVQWLLQWRPVTVDHRVIEGAWLIQDRYRLSWWDALIVSAAQVSRCLYLLTEDLQHGQQFDNLRTVNPFRAGPQDL